MFHYIIINYYEKKKRLKVRGHWLKTKLDESFIYYGNTEHGASTLHS